MENSEQPARDMWQYLRTAASVAGAYLLFTSVAFWFGAGTDLAGGSVRLYRLGVDGLLQSLFHPFMLLLALPILILVGWLSWSRSENNARGRAWVWFFIGIGIQAIALLIMMFAGFGSEGGILIVFGSLLLSSAINLAFGIVWYVIEGLLKKYPGVFHYSGIVLLLIGIIVVSSLAIQSQRLQTSCDITSNYFVMEECFTERAIREGDVSLCSRTDEIMGHKEGRKEACLVKYANAQGATGSNNDNEQKDISVTTKCQENISAAWVGDQVFHSKCEQAGTRLLAHSYSCANTVNRNTGEIVESKVSPRVVDCKDSEKCVHGRCVPATSSEGGGPDSANICLKDRDLIYGSEKRNYQQPYYPQTDSCDGYRCLLDGFISDECFETYEDCAEGPWCTGFRCEETGYKCHQSFERCSEGTWCEGSKLLPIGYQCISSNFQRLCSI